MNAADAIYAELKATAKDLQARADRAQSEAARLQRLADRARKQMKKMRRAANA
jgi:hypothetical protein